MIDYAAGVLAAAILYWLPGWVFLRRTGLDMPTRTVGAVVVSYAVITAFAEVLGAFDVLAAATLAIGAVVIVAIAARWPLPAGAFEPAVGPILRLPLLAALAFGLVILAQAVHPELVRSNDAQATWVPLAVDIAAGGAIAPDSLQTLLEGFPPSVGLIAGSMSLLAGGFAEAHVFIVHPLFAILLLVTVVLLGQQFGGRRAAWIALIAVLATPLLRRGILFHDDLVAAFFAAAATLLAVRARSTAAWVMAGAAAGAAVAVKHLGIVAALLVGAVLIARRPEFVKWAAAAGGWLVGLPWYLWNVLRFGNPVYPLLPELFGESADVIRIVSDHDSARMAAERGSVWEMGALTVVLLGAGMVAAGVRAKRAGDRTMQAFIAALVATLALFVVLWQASGYATRHTLILIPVLAALAGYGLGEIGAREAPSRPSIVAIVAFVALVGLTGAGVFAEYAERSVPEAAQTAPFSVLRGKYNDVRRLTDPPENPFTVFGPIRHAWAVLEGADADPLVFSFDNRSYHIPQRILSATDLAALPVYDAPDPDARHDALLAAGVGYVVDLPGRADRHPLYEEAFWQDLQAHPELYEVLVARDRVRLYRVVGSSGG